MNHRRFTVFRGTYRGINMDTRCDGSRLLPCVDIRESLAGEDIGAAYRTAKRLAGWRGESGFAEEAVKLGSTAGQLRDRHRPAPPSVAAALREAVESYPDEPAEEPGTAADRIQAEVDELIRKRREARRG